MHCLMYGTSLYTELSDLREQSRSNKYKVTYLSGAISQIQLFIEFFFEVINERDEPIVFVVELAKAIIKLKEYRGLRKHEEINVLIDLDMYKQYKAAQAYE